MLDEILRAREKRTMFLMQKFDDKNAIITFSLNIPGESKLGEEKKVFIQKYFFEFLKYIGKITNQISYDFFADANGYIYYVYISKDAINLLELKREALKFEESIGIYGKIIDIDIYKSIFKKISRQDIAQPPRLCFICDKYAKECAFLQSHSKKELDTFVNKVLNAKIPFTLSKEFIFSDLVEQISLGKIKEGDRLKEEELSKKYSVSRTIIREVIQKMKEHDLIDLKQYMGAAIKILAPDEISEMVELRIILKTIILNNIFHNYSDSAKHIFKEIINRIKEIDENDFNMKAIWNVEFHKSIFFLSNKKFTKMLFEKIDITFACINYKWRQAILNGQFDLIDEFISMCECIINRDEEGFNKVIGHYFLKIKTLILGL